MDTPLFNLTLTGTVSPAFDSPLATAPIRPSREADTQDKYRQGEDKTARLPRMAKYFPDMGGLAYVPYFPAAGIRGALRRAARDVMLESIQNDTWGLELHRLLTIGGVGASGPEGDINISAIREFKRKNPLIALFGATSGANHAWVNGALSVGHAIPYHPFTPTIVTGVRTDPLQRNPHEITLLDAAAVAALDTICNAARTVSRTKRQIDDQEKSLKAAKKAGDKDTAAQLATQLTELATILDQAVGIAGTDLSVQMPLPGYEVIPPGLPLSHRLVATQIHDVELGLLVLALDKFAKSPFLGAHHAQGCGIVEASWEVSLGGMAGTLEIKPFMGLVVTGEPLSECLDTAKAVFRQAMAGCTEDSLLPS